MSANEWRSRRVNLNARRSHATAAFLIGPNTSAGGAARNARPGPTPEQAARPHEGGGRAARLQSYGFNLVHSASKFLSSGSFSRFSDFFHTAPRRLTKSEPSQTSASCEKTFERYLKLKNFIMLADALQQFVIRYGQGKAQGHAPILQ
ncbi:MAG: hypothetical protein AAFQ22_15475 [Pseudomonadota bacterium]